MIRRIRRPGPDGDVVLDRDLGPGPLGDPAMRRSPSIGGTLVAHVSARPYRAAAPTPYNRGDGQSGRWRPSKMRDGA